MTLKSEDDKVDKQDSTETDIAAEIVESEDTSDAKIVESSETSEENMRSKAKTPLPPPERPSASWGFATATNDIDESTTETIQVVPHDDEGKKCLLNAPIDSSY